MTRPFITILIPTRERHQTLAATLRTCLMQNYDQMEIIVSDNCSLDRTSEIVGEFFDPRLKYFRSPSRLSMSGNYEFALSHAKPGFVIFIGDDDGLMPNAITTAAEIINNMKVQAVTSAYITYNWPNYPIDNARNLLIIPPVKNKISRKIARQEIIACTSFKKAYQYVWKLPTVYRGFVSTNLITQAMRNGQYFHSITPDAYSAFANAALLEYYAHCNVPLIIEGVSGRSVGASQLIGKDPSEEKAFLTENNIPFHSSLIYAPSGNIVMAEAFLQARERISELKTIDLDYNMLCSAAIWETRHSPNAEKVKMALNKILLLNNLHITSMSRRLYLLALEYYSIVIKIFHSSEINLDSVGIYNVYDAAIFADHILKTPADVPGRSGMKLLWHKIINKFHTRTST